MNQDDLPVLGEPLAVELANTRYGAGETAFDFLEEAAWGALWLEAMKRPQLPHAELLKLRNATHAAVVALLRGTPPSDDVVCTLDAMAERGGPRRHLRWSNDGPCIETIREGTATDRALGALATEITEWFCTDETGALRYCAASDCTMIFVKQHHRRRWCHPSCGHRMRQAAYYRRQRGQA